MALELFRTTSPPLKGDTIDWGGGSYRVTKLKRTGDDYGTVIVYGTAADLGTAQARFRDAWLDLIYAFARTFGLVAFAKRQGWPLKAWVRDREAK